MSTSIIRYIIYGIKFGEEFTDEFFEKEFRDDMEWNENKPNDEPYFISDGMNGLYTFFGFIILLSDSYQDEYEDIEIPLLFTKEDVISSFNKFFPDMKIDRNEIKLYYLPHWV